MKKYDLLKVLGIAFLILVILSWIIVPGTLASGEFTKADTTTPIGLFDLVRLPVITIGTFFQFGIVLLLIGGLYGVVNKTGVYGKLVEGIATHFKDKSKKFLAITMIVLIVLSSLTGLTWVLFVLVPLLAAIILRMGYSRVTALATTVGAILIGSMGSTYGFGINGYIINLLRIDVSYEVITKVVFLVAISICYIAFVLKKSTIKEVDKPKTNKGKNTKKDKKEKNKKTIEEPIDIPLYIESETKERSVWPLVIIFAITFILLLVGMYNFYYSFGLEQFQEFHSKVVEFKVGGYAIFAKLFGTVNALGYWSNYEFCVILVFLAIVIGLIYHVKFKDMVNGFVEGAKQMLAPAIYVVLANIIFAFMVTTGTGYTICDTLANLILSISKDFNACLTALSAAIGSLFYNDFYYLVYSVTGYYQANVGDAGQLEIIGLVYQTIYGLFMLFLPTSLALVAGLSFLKVSYKEWMKYIWMLLLILLVIVIATIVVVAIFA